MTTQFYEALAYCAVPLIVLLLITRYLHQYYMAYCRKTRVVRFKPVVEGNKFQRRPSQSSTHMEHVVKEHLSLNPVDHDHTITISYIDGVDNDFAFFIRNVLTPNECKRLITAAELTGFEQRRYSGKGDDSSSCCFQSNSLSNDVIFNRIKHLLPNKSYFDADSSLTLKELKHFSSNNNQTIECYGMLKCLNTSCRIEKYRSKEHLKIHRDGCVLVPNTCDIFTVYAVLIYLNNDYIGGHTRFCIDIDPNPKDGKYPYSFMDVKGNVGDALIFRHEILHKGGTVERGTKYILRLDAGYQIIK